MGLGLGVAKSGVLSESSIVFLWALGFATSGVIRRLPIIPTHIRALLTSRPTCNYPRASKYLKLHGTSWDFAPRAIHKVSMLIVTDG